ncbi:hypothetical protein FJZ48_00175 [Candidatus Uhrbacteria bacterium]|nr:hypothetical protein [Candidatus Uhrbacteria bacterium]
MYPCVAIWYSTVVNYSRGYSSFSRVRESPLLEKRVTVIAVLFGLGLVFLLLRFFQLQIFDHKTYKVLASDQHEIEATLVPKRGTIYLKDTTSEKLFPVAKDRDAWLVFAMPREIKEAKTVAEELNAIFQTTSTEMFDKISSSSTYVVLQKDVSLEIADTLRAKRLPGIGVSKGVARLYPERGLGGQMIGFVSVQDDGHRVGKYGLEGAFQETLAGTYGSLVAEKDAAGRRLTIGTLDITQAKDGSDIVLTIDRAIQYKACEKIEAAVTQFAAASGVVIVMDPQTGAILAMCGYPDFDPANYGKISDLAVLNNPFINLNPDLFLNP